MASLRCTTNPFVRFKDTLYKAVRDIEHFSSQFQYDGLHVGLIFVSDGLDQSRKTTAQLLEKLRQYENRPLVIYVIQLVGVCSLEEDLKVLEEQAKIKLRIL